MWITGAPVTERKPLQALEHLAGCAALSMRRDRKRLAEGLPRVRSPLLCTPPQPCGVRGDRTHEVLFTAWRNDQDSDCLMDACLCRGGQHGHGTIEAQVDVKNGALQCWAVMARCPPGQRANGPAHPLTSE